MPHPFEFSSGSYGPTDLLVASFRAREHISKPYRFDLIVHSRARDLESAIVGERGTLSLADEGGSARTVAAITSRVRAVGTTPRGAYAIYQVRLVPKLWSLGLSKNSRIFQDMSVKDVIGTILDERGVEYLWKAAREYPPREYCVQFFESDLAFITRLAAEEGIFFFFETDAEGEKVIFADVATHYDPIGGEVAIPFTSSEGMATVGDAVSTFSMHARLAPEATLITGYDYQRPTLDLSVGAAAEALASPDPGRRIYEHDEVWDGFRHGETSARIRMEQHRARARMGQGTSSSKRLSPGRWFTLTGHPLELDGNYAVVGLVHEGRVPEIAYADGGVSPSSPERIYRNEFTVVPADVPYRPRRPKRARRQILETAVVVGPVGEEIHTDAHGRVKVQFHWDRDGKGDDRSSCWVRTMHPWSGAAWGFQFIPRVGMEVVVGFLGGDPDRPMVLGSSYNGVDLPPYPLPAQKTMSGLRTQSTPGKNGYNELRFQDAATQEQVFLKAQRDFDEVVGNDHTRHVTHDEKITVGANRQLDVTGDHIRNIAGNEVITIQKNLVLHVVGKQLITVDGLGADGPAAPSTTAAPADAPGMSASDASAGPGQPGDAPALEPPKTTPDAAAVSFAVEQLPDEVYEQGAALREKSKAFESAAESLTTASRSIDDEYASIASSVIDGPSAMADLVARADMLKKQAELMIIAANNAIAAMDGELADAPVEGPPALQEVDATYRALVASARAISSTATRSTGLVQLMASTVVESGGAVIPKPAITGGGRGGGGGDNVFTQEDGGSKMTVLGKGEINSPQGFKITTAGGSIELGDAGVTITGKVITITSDGVAAINGKPIKLNC